ncbi:MAG: family 10 glycosylhydrolase [Candidatus Sumerlaeaceae bacterium]|nr:family 10 glycosylhydrolase [Candidatus Sumerlaeaceae bacterium]
MGRKFSAVTILAASLLLVVGIGVAKPSGQNQRFAFRGVWLRPEASQTSVTAQLDDIAQAGFTDVYLETFYHGFVIYPSKFVPQRPEMKGTDYLALYLREARQRGLHVHAWLETFYWEVDTKAYPQFPRTPLLDKNPEWRLLLRDGSPTSKVEHAHNFANPAHPGVRQLIANMAEEIVSRYDVAGVNLDYVRYPAGNEDAGYDPYTRRLYKNRYGIDPITIERVTTSAAWRQWVWFREEQVLKTVQMVREQVKKARPKVVLSAAIFPSPEKDRYVSTKFQNWREMLRRGYLDAIAPMAYASSLKGVEEEVQTVLNALPPMSPVQVLPALAVQKRTTDMYGGPAHPPIAQQLSMIHDLDLPGFSVFCYSWILDSDEGLGLLGSWAESRTAKEKE